MRSIFVSENGHDYTKKKERKKKRNDENRVEKKATTTNIDIRRNRVVETTVLCFVIYFVSRHTRLLLVVYLNGAMNVNVHRIHDGMNEQKKAPTSAPCQFN